MNISQATIERSSAIGRLVLDRQTVEDLGRVDRLWLDLESHRTVGLSCKSGLLGGKKYRFSWEQIDTIGTDAILVKSPADGLDFQPPENATSDIGHEVWTDGGKRVGVLVDYQLETRTGAVTHYLFRTEGWIGVLEGVYILPATAVASAGRKRIIVSETVVRDPQQYTEGLGRKMGQAAEFLQGDFEKTLGHLQGFRRATRKLTQSEREGDRKTPNDGGDNRESEPPPSDSDRSESVPPERQSDSPTSS